MKRITLEIPFEEVDVIKNGYIKKISKEDYNFYICGKLYRGLAERRYKNDNDIVIPLKDSFFKFTLHDKHPLLITHNNLEILVKKEGK